MIAVGEVQPLPICLEVIEDGRCRWFGRLHLLFRTYPGKRYLDDGKRIGWHLERKRRVAALCYCFVPWYHLLRLVHRILGIVVRMAHDAQLGIAADGGIGEGEGGRDGHIVVVDDLDDGGILRFIQCGTEVQAFTRLLRQRHGMDEGAVQVATCRESAAYYLDAVGATCRDAAACGGQGGFRAVDGLLHPVLGISPSSQVPPCIVAGIDGGEVDEESLVAAVLHGIHLDGAVVGADIKELVVALQVPWRGDGFGLLEDGLPLSIRHTDVRVGGFRVPRTNTQTCTVEADTVADGSPSDVLLAHGGGHHLLCPVGGRAEAGVGIVVQHVGPPLRFVLVDEDRGIGGHHADI